MENKGRSAGSEGIIWTSCQFANNSPTGNGRRGNRILHRPNGVQYSFSPITNRLAWQFGLLSAELLTQIMQRYPATSGIIKFVYGINRNFSPRGIEWVRHSRPCNVPGTGEGTLPEQRYSDEYTHRQIPSWEELIGGMANPRELAAYMNRNTPALLEGYNNFWNEAAYLIYRFYKRK